VLVSVGRCWCAHMPEIPVLRGQVLKQLRQCFERDDADPQSILRGLHERMQPAAIIAAVRETDRTYRIALERQILLALQRQRQVSQLEYDCESAKTSLAATQLELEVAREEWQQMHQRVEEAEQRMASVDARNIFLEKSDEARRMMHNELRDTQRRLVECRDEHESVQGMQAQRQLDLEQQVQDLGMIQDEVGALLRIERTDKKRLESANDSARKSATQAVERVGSLLEQNTRLEEEFMAMKASVAKERLETVTLRAAMKAWPEKLRTLQRECDAKISELVITVH
jgi:chromosome segregation ATPase